jgi:DUF1680 family protein
MKEFQSVDFSNIKLDKGFWHQKQKMNSETTIYSIWMRFVETGRFDAFKFEWKQDMPNKPHIFWESDVAKWIEAVAYILENVQDKKLEQAVDEIVELIEKHQEPSGYFNIFFTVIEPENRWKKRTEHELYCAGHLIEAAVAYYKATGKDKFLNQMCRYADHIEKAFVIEKSTSFVTCGHEEIELALVRLYHCTGERRYLELSKFFIDSRGNSSNNDEFYPCANSRYAQDHLPVREQSTAEGHAVRAIYLYCAMADLALEYNDKELFNASRSIFENIVYKRMYITGGIGSSSMGEAFTIDYDLPNQTAYTESCAAIALMLFSRRMLLLEADSLYSDTAERALYNGFLSSISLDGKSFFYENPLEIDPALRNRDISIENGKSRYPIMERLEVFECSCCPPNISRFIASIGDMLYTSSEDTLYVHHYINSSTIVNIIDRNVEIKQETNYPQNGNVMIIVNGLEGKKVAIRIPYWCKDYTINVNNSNGDFAIVKGYAFIDCASETTCLDIDFKMEVQLIEASPLIQENAGRVAVQRGPIVYCLEEVDNGKYLRDVAIDLQLNNLEIKYDKVFGANVIKVDGFVRNAEKFENLYQPLGSTFKKKRLKFIPYYAFANRGESEMIVWIQKH